MRYYVLTTTKFANECMKNKVYGSTNANWLANIELGDIVFISQFSYKSQDIYGPFKVSKTLFYDKKIIYPNKRYYYRIKIKPVNLKLIEETDVYLQGVKNHNLNSCFRLINLIQQNKHLHSISLVEKEGELLLDAMTTYGKSINVDSVCDGQTPDTELSKVDLKFLENKNKLFLRKKFSSESDLESYILISLKDKQNQIYKNFEKILDNYPQNSLTHSNIYNQFIFGNAYPSDLVIINNENVNIFELKKDQFNNLTTKTIEKELKKYCYYSLYSARLKNVKIRMNFFLVFLKNEDHNFHKTINKKFKIVTESISKLRENNLIILEYFISDGKLLFTAIPPATLTDIPNKLRFDSRLLW